MRSKIFKMALILSIFFAALAGSWSVFEKPCLVFAGSHILGGKDYKPLAPLPYAAPKEGVKFSTYVAGAFKLGIGVAGVLAVLMLVVGGFVYASSDAVTKKEDGIRIMTNAVLGLVLALLSYLIFYTINPNLAKLDGVSVSSEKEDGNSQKVYDPDAPQVTVPFSGSDTNNPSLFPINR
ncbi:MAG: hypothetical protein HYT43_01295 [Candidatus Taylorbacteria bacterium]|nr:hypothetical protein [Candidatus Taylorbacteria bacterium]